MIYTVTLTFEVEEDCAADARAYAWELLHSSDASLALLRDVEIMVKPKQ